MAEKKKGIGEIAWLDLTVGDAESVRDFYADVVGWTITPVDMGDYDDYCMNAPGTGEATAGVCFSRGSNAGLPPVWLAYVVVENIERSVERCRARGGRVIGGPRDMGPQGKYCIIEDPAGAALALFQHSETA
ncbi:MAG: VOC family protein [Rhodothermales bacterium]|jgi:hypothetical protein